MTATPLTSAPGIARGLTLGEFLVPARLRERLTALQRDALLVVGGTLLITAGAYVSFAVPAIQLGNIYVPVNPYVPLTLQTFGVLFTGALLGARRGVAATGLYLLLGIVGLPVFAAGADGVRPSGVESFVSWTDGSMVLATTAGYRVGFVVAAAIVGRMAELGWDRRFRSSVAAMAIGSIVIYVIGVAWLALALSMRGLPDPLNLALVNGLYPFIPGDIVKLLVAAGLLPLGWRLVARQRHDL